MISSKEWKVAGSVLMLTAGIGIYLLFRSGDMLVFRLTQALGLHSLLEGWRSMVSDVMLPGWVRYCLPNALWALAYVLLIDAIFHRHRLSTRMTWAAVIPACGLAGELLQALHLLPGTFDWGDVAAFALPYLLYYTIRLKTYCHED